MPDTDELVINTGPLIAISAALGALSVLKTLYNKVYVTYEVCEEMQTTGARLFALTPFKQAKWLLKQNKHLNISSYLNNSLDRGEASVIQFALDRKIPKVCIDEAAGRRIARLNGLTVTGSIGILIRARKEGFPFSMREAIDQIVQKNVWLSEKLINLALREVGELKS